MSESNRVSLRFIEESTWGTTPATPTMQALRHTDQSLRHDLQTTQSNEIRSDRSISDLIQTDRPSGGGFNFELSGTTFDDFMEGAMCAAWATYSSTAWAATTGYSLDDLRIPTSANGFVYKCTTAGTSDSSEPTWPTTIGGTVTDGSVEWTCESFNDYLLNGTTKKSYSIEKAYLDITQFMQFTGMMVNTMSLEIAAGSPITGSFEFLGKTPADALTQATVATSVTPATTTEVMNAIGNVGTIEEGGSALSGVYIKNSSFTVNNNLRVRNAIGYDSAVDVKLGRQEVTGSIEVYFADETLYDKFAAGTATSLSFTVTKNSQSYTFYFPNVKYEAVNESGGASDQDVTHSFNFRALYDSTAGGHFLITRDIT